MGRGLFYLFLFLAIFHRPLLETGLRLALIKVASSHNVKLDVHFSGSFFTNLTISGIHAEPIGSEPSAIEKIDIQAVRLEYSVPMLIQHGVGEFLRSYELSQANLIFRPQHSGTTKEEKKSLAEDLNNLLGQPALYADRVKIENFSLIVRGDEGDTEVKSLNFYLHPWDPGYLRIERIQVPGFTAWEHIAATTSYAQRNLFIKDLALDPQIVVDELNFDASQRAQHKGSLELKGRFFGGSADFNMSGSQLNKKGRELKSSYDTTLGFHAAGIDIQAAANYFHAKNVPAVRLGWLAATFGGEPETPKTWKGNFGIHLDALGLDKISVDAIEFDTVFADGQAKVTYGGAVLGRNVWQCTGQAALPEAIGDFAKTDAALDFTLAFPDLPGAVGSFLPGKQIAGAVNGRGAARLHAGEAKLTSEIEAAKFALDTAGAASAKLQLEATKRLDSQDPDPLQGLQATIDADLQGLYAGSTAIDSVGLGVDLQNGAFTVRRADVARGENRISLQGNGQLPKSGQDLSKLPLNGDFSVQLPKLEDFGVVVKDRPLTGHIEATGRIATDAHGPAGTVQITGADFALGAFKAQSLAGKIAVANGEVSVDEVKVQIDGSSQISVAGKAGLDKPNVVEGAVLVLFKDLGVLNPLLQVFGVNEPLSGSLDFTVEGQGKAETKEFQGDLKLAVDKARYGKFDLKEVRLAAIVGPNFAETSQLRVVTGATSFEGGLEWKENRLKLHDINLRQGTTQVLSGYVSVPFEPQNSQAPLPFEKRVALNINANQLDIEKLLTSLGQTAPASGIVTANLLAGGTLLEPTASFKISAKGLKAKAAPQFDPAEFDFAMNYAAKDLTLDATARQKEIQPLTIKGHIPLDLDATLKQKKLDPELPLDVTVKLPPTSLAFLPKVVFAMRSAAGNVGLDAHVGGTVGKPHFSGSAALNIDYARMKSEGVPAIGTLHGNLAFTEESLAIQKFHGEIGGGGFDLSGKVQFAKITEPIFDIHLKCNSVLVARNDSVTVRVDTDLAATGPLAAGKLGGTVWITQSRFFRDIDILPIALPGRPKAESQPQPQPLSAPSSGGFSLGPPLAGWTFDIAVKTRADDPFRVRGNLANGAAAVDLKFAGTGAAPTLDGNVHIENFVASLPFSKLSITRGFISFSKDSFLQPKLDVYAESNLRDYHISAYIFGSAKDPQLSLTSEPPLPQQDILSLLATGATLGELTGKNDVLASRAAMLVFQQLYHKVFKTKEKADNTPVLDRLNIDAGAVDSRTGHQEVAATFKLTDQFYLVGDVDVTGQFSGQVKYLIRFK